MNDRKKPRISIIIIAIALLTLTLWLPVHEAINWAIFRAYGINSTIGFGLLKNQTDCPVLCQPAPFTAFAWTTPNTTEYYALKPQSFARMESLLAINEQADQYIPVAGVMAISFIATLTLLKRGRD